MTRYGEMLRTIEQMGVLSPPLNINVIQDPLDPTMTHIQPQDLYFAVLMLWADGQLQGPRPQWCDFYVGLERSCRTTWTDPSGNILEWRDGQLLQHSKIEES